MPDEDKYHQVNWQSDFVALYECKRCGALVAASGKEKHDKWHTINAIGLG